MRKSPCCQVMLQHVPSATLLVSLVLITCSQSNPEATMQSWYIVRFANTLTVCPDQEEDVDIGTNDQPYEQSVPAEDMEVDEKPQVSIFPICCLPAHEDCGDCLKHHCSAICKASWPGLQQPFAAWVCIRSTWSSIFQSLVTAIPASTLCFIACVLSGQRGHPVSPILYQQSQPGLWVDHTLFMCCIAMQAQVNCKSRLLLLALIPTCFI